MASYISTCVVNNIKKRTIAYNHIHEIYLWELAHTQPPPSVSPSLLSVTHLSVSSLPSFLSLSLRFFLSLSLCLLSLTHFSLSTLSRKHNLLEAHYYTRQPNNDLSYPPSLALPDRFFLLYKDDPSLYKRKKRSRNARLISSLVSS